MRAWAILMMLQGHFIDGLLDPVFRDPDNGIYRTWLYFRGITAPVFFTASGFIFTYLLLRAPVRGLRNPRIRKGVRRGLQLLLIGYLLRTNLLGLLKGHIYPSFYLVDVLHCIGAALLLIIGIYLLTSRLRPILFPLALVLFSLSLFLWEPVYKLWEYPGWPKALANYFTRANGSVFTIIPWVGYTAIGGALAALFRHYATDRHLYRNSIVLTLLAGWALVSQSSRFFSRLADWTGAELFDLVVANNYLFIRLGDVLLVFAAFMIARRWLKKDLFLKIGQNTLSIYVIHFIILYGSFTGLGLYRFFNHSLTPAQAIPGAIAFMVGCTAIALFYDANETRILGPIRQAASALRRRVADRFRR